MQLHAARRAAPRTRKAAGARWQGPAAVGDTRRGGWGSAASDPHTASSTLITVARTCGNQQQSSSHAQTRREGGGRQLTARRRWPAPARQRCQLRAASYCDALRGGRRMVGSAGLQGTPQRCRPSPGHRAPLQQGAGRPQGEPRGHGCRLTRCLGRRASWSDGWSLPMLRWHQLSDGACRGRRHPSATEHRVGLCLKSLQTPQLHPATGCRSAWALSAAGAPSSLTFRPPRGALAAGIEHRPAGGRCWRCRRSAAAASAALPPPAAWHSTPICIAQLLPMHPSKPAAVPSRRTRRPLLPTLLTSRATLPALGT